MYINEDHFSTWIKFVVYIVDQSQFITVC